jgi:hypothetical protein
MPPIGVDFILPGFSNPETHKRFKLARVNIQNTITNPHNVEDRTYPLWQIICDALVSDCYRFLICPQLRLWYIVPEQSKEESDHDLDIGNTSLDTVSSSTLTISGRRATELFPDFGLIRINYKRRTNAQGHNWRTIKARFQGAPILIENKRPSSRRLTGYLYLVGVCPCNRTSTYEHAEPLESLRKHEPTKRASSFDWGALVSEGRPPT